MKLQVLNIVNTSDFQNFIEIVESFDVINPFYKIFGASLEDASFDELHYFTLSNELQDVLVLMPFYLRKIPYKDQEQTYFDVISPYGYSGPLYNETMSRGYLLLFWKQVDAWYKEHHVVSEFIRFSLNHNHQFYSGVLLPTLTNVRGRVIEPQAQWESFKQKVRNNYRKAKDSGLICRVYDYKEAESQLETFYAIYIATMQRIGADDTYFYSLNYFKNIVSLSKENVLIVIIYKDAIPISTELVLIAGSTLYSFLGGTLSDYFQFRPNDFLKIEVMTWAYKHGFEYYLLGGGRQDGDSLFQYKKTFFLKIKMLLIIQGGKL